MKRVILIISIVSLMIIGIFLSIQRSISSFQSYPSDKSIGEGRAYIDEDTKEAYSIGLNRIHCFSEDRALLRSFNLEGHSITAKATVGIKDNKLYLFDGAIFVFNATTGEKMDQWWPDKPGKIGFLENNMLTIENGGKVFKFSKQGSPMHNF